MKKKAKPAPKKKAASGNHDKALREHLVFLLKGRGAHGQFIDAAEGFPEAKRGTFIAGLPHTGWQLSEHSRIPQWHLLEVSRHPNHVRRGLPERHCPETPGPPDR